MATKQAAKQAAKHVLITEQDYDRLQRLIDSPQYRITHSVLLSSLKGELERGKVVPPTEVPRGTVTMNSRVKVRDLKRDEEETYTLVYPEEADLDEGKVSVLAPIGTALLGTRVGQTVTVEAPAGTRRIKVEQILYQPEAAGHLHL